MNYYDFHIGDYASRTAHLEPMEDLAYRRLLDLYYMREEPLTPDISDIARLIRMRSNLQDVESVLKEFFTQDADGRWRHSRCDEVIAHAAEKRAKAKNSADSRWGKKDQDANAMPPHNERNADAMPPQSNGNAPSPNPIPISTSKEVRKRTRKSSESCKFPIPDDFGISERVRAWAIEKGYAQLEAHLENFISKSKANAYVYADWDEAFMGAVRKDWAGVRNQQAPPTETAYQRSMRERVAEGAGSYAGVVAAKPPKPFWEQNTEVIDATTTPLIAGN